MDQESFRAGGSKERIRVRERALKCLSDIVTRKSDAVDRLSTVDSQTITIRRTSLSRWISDNLSQIAKRRFAGGPIFPSA